MCGILGYIGRPIEKESFEKTLSLLNHRGPDGFGIWRDIDNHLTLGHRRLSIIDLSVNANQPIEYHDYILTFNGEIYNYIELRKELQSKGFKFRTESDSEVLLAAYME